MLELVAPSERYETSYREADVERGRDGTAASFFALLEILARERDGRIDGEVATTELWLVDGVAYVGKLRIRHALDEPVDWRGHFGCTIRPSRRRQGHATRLLALALPRLLALGIDPALVTCEPSNLASRRLIARFKGTFLDAVERGPDLPVMLRFRLPTR